MRAVEARVGHEVDVAPVEDGAVDKIIDIKEPVIYTVTSVAYDAETTRGGSGGPVLSLDGEVVAVTFAILAEFGGSNLGVPTEEVRRLLAEATALTDRGDP